MRIRKSVGAFLFNKKGKVLLVIHPRGNGYYNIPKGGVEEGETLKEALRRELKEELSIDNFGKIINLDLSFGFKLPEDLRIKKGADYQEVKMFYVEFLGDEEEIKPDNDEISWAGFVSTEEFFDKVPFEETKNLFRKFLESRII
ncbi:MAG: NUDIX hydrolase [Candidatus Aenigmarchaeota archaeon]|nr:NUDIX hydrolase [Candidatus Aenigmarchaeota archaeon]